MPEKISKICKELKNVLPSKRYNHTLGVMYTACSMAMCHGEDVVKAQYAGLLHDCAKYLSGEEKIELCKQNGISISSLEYKNTELLHAKVGALFAEKKYGITDNDILEAIRWHTTGKPDMTLLEQILFVADYIEPNRKMLPNMETIRYYAFHNLSKCIVLIIENTLQYLEGKKGLVDETSQATYKFYKNMEEYENE